MSSEEQALRVALFSDLGPEQKEEVLKFFFARHDPHAIPSFIKDVSDYWSSRKYKLVFCALLGSKVLGISPYTRHSGGYLTEDGPTYAVTPKSFLLKTNKTVGRILLDEIAKYGKHNNLKVPVPWGETPSGIRLIKRMNRRLDDTPNPVTRKSSWRTRKR